MNWAGIRTALEAAVVSTTGLDDSAVAWKGTPKANQLIKGNVRALLSVKSAQKAARDEERRFTVSENPLDPQEVHVGGPRLLPWSVRFESQGTDANSLAEQFATNFQTRIERRSTATAYLLPSNLSVAETNMATGEFKKQGRDFQFAVVDVLLNAVEDDIDTTPDYGATINTVLFSSDVPNGPELQDVDGNPSANQLSGEESV